MSHTIFIRQNKGVILKTDLCISQQKKSNLCITYDYSDMNGLLTGTFGTEFTPKQSCICLLKYWLDIPTLIFWFLVQD